MSEGSSVVRLEVAGDHRHVRVARLVASGVASLAGYDVEAVEDLRIAVDEGCVWLIEHGTGEPLRLSFEILPDRRIEVRGSAAQAPGADATASVLVEQILAASCETHHFGAHDGELRFELTARAEVRTAIGPGGAA